MWLTEEASSRIHGTTGERPDRRLALERAALLPLPLSNRRKLPATPVRNRPIPAESLLHPLSVYNTLLEVRL